MLCCIASDNISIRSNNNNLSRVITAEICTAATARSSYCIIYIILNSLLCHRTVFIITITGIILFYNISICNAIFSNIGLLYFCRGCIIIGKSNCTIRNRLYLEAGSDPGIKDLQGSDISSMKPDQIARVLSVVTTERPDPEWMTVYEMTATGRYPYTGRMGILSPQDRQIVEEAMELLSVSALADTYFSSLSDGQKQRVMLARSIAQQPDLILMDEPTSFLDIRYRLEFAEMARMLAREKDIALLISIHEIDLAEQVADRILCLKNGRIQAAGRPEAVLTDSCLEELFDISPGTYHNRYIRKT